jgi:diguanylate cyclase (GGDEF)-like protein
MNELEALASRFRAAFDSYLSAIHSFERHGLAGPADASDQCRRQLEKLRGELQPDSEIEILNHSRERLAQILQEYSQNSVVQAREREREVRDIVGMVEEAAKVLAARSARYDTKFQDVTRELETASRINNLSQLRQRLAGAVSNLKATVDTFRDESRESVAQMQSKVSAYHDRLKRAEQMVNTDPLTGLSNRRAAQAGIREEIVSRSPFCLAVLDLNGFKSVNDRFGHACGDQVLTEFARGLRRFFRADDAIYRWGGDEFVAVMRGPLDEVRKVLRPGQLIEQLVSVSVSGKQMVLALGAAVGVAEYQSGEGPEELFARADASMYKEKSQHRTEPALRRPTEQPVV